MTEMRRDPRRATPPDASCPGILVAVPRSGGRTSVIVTTVAVMSQAVTAPAIATAVPAAPHPDPPTTLSTAAPLTKRESAAMPTATATHTGRGSSISKAVAGIVRVARPRAVPEVIRPSCAAGIRTVNRAPTLDNSITDQ